MAIVIAVLVPAISLAAHQFTDVPSSSPYHGNISKLVESGITAGCGSGKFCPKANVTREQMAAFLTRGLGRVAGGRGWIPFHEADEYYVTTVSIAAGGASGGSGFVQVNASLTGFTDLAGVCPCWIYAWIADHATGDIVGTTGFIVTDDAVGPDAPWRAASGAMTGVVRIPSGSSRLFGLAVHIQATGTLPVDSASTQLWGSMTASYAPFGSTGGSTLAQPDVSSGPFAPTGPVTRNPKD